MRAQPNPSGTHWGSLVTGCISHVKPPAQGKLEHRSMGTHSGSPVILFSSHVVPGLQGSNRQGSQSVNSQGSMVINIGTHSAMLVAGSLSQENPVGHDLIRHDVMLTHSASPSVST